MNRWLILTLALTLSVATPAAADDWADCTQGADRDLGGSACTNIINSGREKGERLAIAYYNRGHAYGRKGDYDRAIADLDQAIKLKPDLAEAYYNRGTAAYYAKGDTDRAIADYDKAIALRPDLAEAYYNRGYAYGRKGDTDRAIADYDKAIALRPDLDDAYNNRGIAYYRKGDTDRAIADYDKAIALRPDLDAYNNRGIAYYGKGDYDRAIADYDKAIALRPDLADAYNNRGNAYYRKGDYDRAIADYDKAIQLKPDFAEAYHSRGETYYTKGDAAQALIDFRLAARLIQPTDPGNAQAVARIAEIEKKLAAVTPQPKVETPATSEPAAIALGRRVALVIGNSGYANGRLTNPRNDAELMTRTLRSVGFEVTELIDADQETMKRAMLDFGRKLRADADASLFYYAGHGVQVAGENYLIPVDAEIDDEGEVDLQAVNVNSFLGIMEGSASKINIVVLDACRNNPFARSFRSESRGLAMVDAPSGTYIAFATAPGKVAADGDDGNSPYTKALAEALVVPGRRIEDAFKKAREIVMAETDRAQVPWETTSIVGDFYFVPAR